MIIDQIRSTVNLIDPRNAVRDVPAEPLRQEGDGWVAGMDTSVGCDPPFLSDVVEDGWIMSREGRHAG
jgi:hypothetical protein